MIKKDLSEAKQLHLYRVSWGWYEEYEPIILTHEKKFTQAEFKKMVIEAVRSFFFHQMEQNEHVGFLVDWSEYVIKYLCEKYGFELAKFVADVGFWGMTSIRKNADEYELKQIREILSEEELEMIDAHNRKIDKEIVNNLNSEEE